MDDEDQMERRRSFRKSGNQYPLSIGRHSARLLDWSANSVGIHVREGTAGYQVGDTVKIAILSERTHGVAVFTGCVRRIDPGIDVLGIDLTDGGRDAATFLVELLDPPDSSPGSTPGSPPA
jgi:hypothetical protein